MAVNAQKLQLIEHVLELEKKVYRALRPIVPQEWLRVDLTMPQLKVMLLLFTDGPKRMGDLASTLGVSLATATPLVDRLVRRQLILRVDDPNDRRVVVCELSETGHKLVGRLWELGLAQTRRLLETMDTPKLQLIAGGMEAILDAVSSLKQHRRSAAPRNETEGVCQP